MQINWVIVKPFSFGALDDYAKISPHPTIMIDASRQTWFVSSSLSTYYHAQDSDHQIYKKQCVPKLTSKEQLS